MKFSTKTLAFLMMLAFSFGVCQAQDCNSFNIEFTTLSNNYCANDWYIMEFTIEGDDQDYEYAISVNGSTVASESVNGPGTYGTMFYTGSSSSQYIYVQAGIENLGMGMDCEKSLDFTANQSDGPYVSYVIDESCAGSGGTVNVTGKSASQFENHYTIDWNGADPGDYFIEPENSNGFNIVNVNAGSYNIDFEPNNDAPSSYCPNENNLVFTIDPGELLDVEYSWEYASTPVFTDEPPTGASITLVVNDQNFSPPLSISGPNTNINFGTQVTLNNVPFGYATYTIYPAEGCAGEVVFDLPVWGCMSEEQCFYDPSAEMQAIGCGWPGCMDPLADDYDSTALCEGPCFYGVMDLSDNGVIDTEDLLLMIGDIGCIGSCVGDFNSDGVTNVWDLLMMLGEI